MYFLIVGFISITAAMRGDDSRFLSKHIWTFFIYYHTLATAHVHPVYAVLAEGANMQVRVFELLSLQIGGLELALLLKFCHAAHDVCSFFKYIFVWHISSLFPPALHLISFSFGVHNEHIAQGSILPETLPFRSRPSSVTIEQWWGFIKYTQL